uniref:Uncharacterized protein n=1 Tax=Human herpesvirus 2 TaxID=10310 RepID=A0A2U9DVH2_HHV2|nr:hypothetical protein [Human alphaherpesvirus 2]AWP48421.1 hypothetical protein [Human alphaherpesvirus 2]AWP48490.1 hypothetical protein [Human alphaherpesvirus 2]AWP48569.1 hypothetical protein [Human alphaherpesvirus 2]AWP48584.1 hypothetical protein [Human alphaherpesvirus 2]
MATAAATCARPQPKRPAAMAYPRWGTARATLPEMKELLLRAAPEIRKQAWSSATSPGATRGFWSHPIASASGVYSSRVIRAYCCAASPSSGAHTGAGAPEASNRARASSASGAPQRPGRLSPSPPYSTRPGGGGPAPGHGSPLTYPSR